MGKRPYILIFTVLSALLFVVWDAFSDDITLTTLLPQGVWVYSTDPGYQNDIYPANTISPTNGSVGIGTKNPRAVWPLEYIDHTGFPPKFLVDITNGINKVGSSMVGIGTATNGEPAIVLNKGDGNVFYDYGASDIWFHNFGGIAAQKGIYFFIDSDNNDADANSGNGFFFRKNGENAPNTDNAEMMAIRENGYVGIGTTNPGSILHIVNTDNPAGALRGITHDQYSSSGSSTYGGAQLTFRRANGTPAAPGIPFDGDEIGSLQFSAWDGNDFDNAAYIRAKVDGRPVHNRIPASLVFATTPSLGPNVPTEYMRIHSNGCVGIGQPAPGGKLTVATNDGSIQLLLQDLRNVVPVANRHRALLVDRGKIIFRKFVGNPGASQFFDQMVIDTNGNVGIGLPGNPSAKLDVGGNIKADLSNVNDGSANDMDWLPSTREIGYDIAELYETVEDVEPADVLIIGPEGKLSHSNRQYDYRVAGIVSDSPAVLFEGSHLEIAPKPFNFQKGNKPPVAIAGRVLCRVTAEGGKIQPGDLLVTSSTFGHAMKADPDKLKPGMLIGKALGSLDKGTGKIMVLVKN